MAKIKYVLFALVCTLPLPILSAKNKEKPFPYTRDPQRYIPGSETNIARVVAKKPHLRKAAAFFKKERPPVRMASPSDITKMQNSFISLGLKILTKMDSTAAETSVYSELEKLRLRTDEFTRLLSESLDCNAPIPQLLALKSTELINEINEYLAAN